MKRRAHLRRPSQLLDCGEILEQVLAVAVGGNGRADGISPNSISPDNASPPGSSVDSVSTVPRDVSPP